jgi:cation diffusion facilitator family transporter
VSSPSLQLNLRATLIGFTINSILGATKLVAGILGHSEALIADAVESFADLLAAVIVWRGVCIAAKPADAEHPYGHGKAEPLAAAGIGTLLLIAAAGIGVHAFREFLHPHRGPEPFTLAVLIVVVAIKEGLFRWVQSQARLTGSRAVESDAWHHRSDAITSLAAAVGITIALVGGKAWSGAEDIAALVAAGIIAWNGWSILRPALEDLMDTQPSPEILAQIHQAASAVSSVDCIQKILVRRMGNRLLVDMHVHVHPLMTVEHSHRIAHQVKDVVRHAVPTVLDVLIHIEPSAHPIPPCPPISN